MSDDNMVTYRPHDHGTDVRVVETWTGRHGVVVRIEETSYEWIEPVVRWDRDENGVVEESRARGLLVLERT